MSGPVLLVCFVNLVLGAAIYAHTMRRDRGTVRSAVRSNRLPEVLTEALSGVGAWQTENVRG